MLPFDSCEKKASYFPSSSLLAPLIASCLLLLPLYLCFASSAAVLFPCQLFDHPGVLAGLMSTLNRCLLPKIASSDLTLDIAGESGTQACKKNQLFLMRSLV